MAKRTLPVLQTAHLSKTFRDFWRRPRVEAVQDLNMEIMPGEIVGLLGPNGSGKTTTIKMILGLLYPTRGRISVFGKPPTDVSVKSRIGFLPEESYLYRFLVASETLDYFGRLFCLPSSVRDERIVRLLDMVGLSHEGKRPVGEFSKGMARRIGLAQALINDPEFLILDEPTSGLDPLGVRQIKDLIRYLGERGKTILLSSHVLADVEDVCDRVIILYGGQQRAEGSIDELLSQTDRTQITTGALSDATLTKLQHIIEQEEPTATAGDFDVKHPRDRLEDLFLRIVHEAQAANVRTSGARTGGSVPTFLSQATKSQTFDDVVGELLSAAERDAAPAPAEQLPPAPVPASAGEQDEGKDILDELMGTRDEEVPEPATAQKPESSQEPAPEDDTPRSEQVEADRHVIDDLLGAPAGESDDKSSS